jgi:hypothetical protein
MLVLLDRLALHDVQGTGRETASLIKEAADASEH